MNQIEYNIFRCDVTISGCKEINGNSFYYRGTVKGDNLIVCNNTFYHGFIFDFSIKMSNNFTITVEKQHRPIVDMHPNGKWRIGDTIGLVPKGNDCIIEGFVVRKGKTIKRGKVTYVFNNNKETKYILRGNDIG